MKLLRGVKDIANLTKGSVVTIGNFDGVHLGHQALLALLRQKADELKLPLVVVLFEPQPGEFFQGEKAPARLSSLREKLHFLTQSGVDIVCCLKFDKHLAQMRAELFARRYLFEALNCKYLLTGEDFCFGYQREGNFSLLKNLGVEYFCTVSLFPDFIVDELRVSSTKIREALKTGELGIARQLLGRPYSMCGRVIKGDARGRQWGIPTANLALHRRSLPLKGVFCVKVKNNHHWLNGVANIGSRPTVDGTKNILEIHLMDFDEELYGELLEVFFLHKLRNEVKFNSIDDLIQQIHKDITEAKHYFHE
ncbi:bifunctional riboflavin kinase/FAD synthetase [Legionella israelensis]|uniref:Riboflavin biosynthesis protein n=1 Tax=Legionella israelensis TaxID=454 RepID=A0A0W0VTZ1_9GAMM|nr:bifunctional riboflavin kinase/FAD synthetase [Legionella israelensis]KTD23716.1 riboflavin biosynthesis protein RibF (riboflavin kinase/FMN adenylyltransferase) [Legionella israelensis]QBS10904.1 bifunctional riboflavin kinase/FAD synthetase [Legionella israelensis]SCX80156.1 FMN adenylyltransferase [Legionella israelensis DSM 19235]STX57892.1 riboflavin biosynthesis protein RibF (riboflavin kinase/FMN adenylyltransferase) [Legionella israelensis]